ncbi:hypothetical protein DFJ74DRAFT_714408 [Hyaloraphidium curvatum]|nr:hypothetical protein DFJ74DRAFT_714408 [Hyaloraphidium curvatum]
MATAAPGASFAGSDPDSRTYLHSSLMVPEPPDLPEELLALVAEHLSRAGLLRTLASLAQASSAGLDAVMPALFRTVCLGDSAFPPFERPVPFGRFFSAAGESPNLRFVRHLMLAGVHLSAADDLESMLLRMRDVEVTVVGTSRIFEALAAAPAVRAVRCLNKGFPWDRAPPALGAKLVLAVAQLDTFPGLLAMQGLRLKELRFIWFPVRVIPPMTEADVDRFWSSLSAMDSVETLQLDRIPTGELWCARLPPSLRLLVLRNAQPSLPVGHADAIGMLCLRPGLRVRFEFSGPPLTHGEAWRGEEGRRERDLWAAFGNVERET